VIQVVSGVSPVYNNTAQFLTTLLEQLGPTDQDATVAWARPARPGEIGNPPRLEAQEQILRIREAEIMYPESACATGFYCRDLRVETPELLRGQLLGAWWEWGRKNYHTKGFDIRLPFHRTYRESDFFVKAVHYSEVLAEWRITVFDDAVISRGLKHTEQVPLVERGGMLVYDWPEGAIADLPVSLRRWNTSKTNFIRNRRNGWLMRHDIDPPIGLRASARGAVAACGYLWGAVDLLLLRPTTEVPYHRVMVLEVNTAPGLDNYGGLAFARAMRRKAGV
jgi:hypothetical protein